MYFFVASSSWLEDLTDWIGMIKIVVALFFGSGVLFVCVFCVVCVRVWTICGRRWWMGFFFQGIWAASSGAGKRVSERAGKYWTHVTVLVLLLSILVSSWFNPCLKCVALREGTDRSLCGSASYFSSSPCGQWRQDSCVSGAACWTTQNTTAAYIFSCFLYIWYIRTLVFCSQLLSESHHGEVRDASGKCSWVTSLKSWVAEHLHGPNCVGKLWKEHCTSTLTWCSHPAFGKALAEEVTLQELAGDHQLCKSPCS